MKLLTIMDSLTNGKEEVILHKLSQLMIGIMILVLMLIKKQEIMRHHIVLMMDGQTFNHFGIKIKSCQDQLLPHLETKVLNQ